MLKNNLLQAANKITDITAYGTVIATLAGWLPAISAAFAIIWIAMQMLKHETGRTVTDLVRYVWKKLRG